MPPSPVQTYEALLSHPEHIAQVRAARQAIERMGGALQILPPTHEPGMTLVVLSLPAAYHPDTFFPGLPFSLV